MLNAFFVALAVFVGVGGHELFGMVMLSRPIVVAPLTGLLLGDVQTGLLVGASLESIFMGVVNVGISSTAEPALAAGLAQPSQFRWVEMLVLLFQSYSHLLY